MGRGGRGIWGLVWVGFRGNGSLVLEAIFCRLGVFIVVFFIVERYG